MTQIGTAILSIFFISIYSPSFALDASDGITTDIVGGGTEPAQAAPRSPIQTVKAQAPTCLEAKIAHAAEESIFANRTAGTRSSPQAVRSILSDAGVTVTAHGNAGGWYSQLQTPENGFVPLDGNIRASAAPPGSIFVVQGGPYGDIRIKGENGDFYSDHKSESFTPGGGYKLAGVLVPGPDLEKKCKRAKK